MNTNDINGHGNPGFPFTRSQRQARSAAFGNPVLHLRNCYGNNVRETRDFPGIAEAEAFAKAQNGSESCTGSPDPRRIITDIYRPSDGMVHVVTA